MVPVFALEHKISTKPKELSILGFESDQILVMLYT